MRIGLFHSIHWPAGSDPSEQYEQALTQACHADVLGFDSVWLTEHHVSRHGTVSDSLMVLAHLAARTSTVRLGTAVSVLPLHHPLHFAEAAATVDSCDAQDWGVLLRAAAREIMSSLDLFAREVLPVVREM